MEPISESRAAFEELGPFVGDEIEADLDRMARRVKDLVPSCVGMSLSVHDAGLTFTLVATDDEVRRLDAAQYLDDGPCLAAAEHEAVVEVPDTSSLGEDEWQLFAQASRAAGVRSTLTIPLHESGRLTGTVNIYAADATAFRGLAGEIAALVGGWAPGVVLNADLSFSTRETAAGAPEKLAADAVVAQAVGLMVAARHLTSEQALALLEQAALRSGLRVVDVARILVDIRDSP